MSVVWQVFRKTVGRCDIPTKQAIYSALWANYQLTLMLNEELTLRLPAWLAFVSVNVKVFFFLLKVYNPFFNSQITTILKLGKLKGW